jgi:DNA-directed RNA polymerase subunit RPC12/RpoP
MTDYIIEGGLDFYSELYNSLDIQEEEFKTNEDENKCLITNLPLIDRFFKMDCGHKFNYIPLFLDIKNHKQKFNGMEGSSSRLKTNEIRCPYCRHKHNGVLPYYEDLNLGKLNGVNYIDPNIKSTSSGSYKYCEFLEPNPSYDPSGNNPVETSSHYNTGNCKFLKCFHMGSQINYYNGLVEGENYGDEKYYCWSHKKKIIKKYKKDISDKMKEEVKLAKIKVKAEIKQAKDDVKQKIKEEKQKAKEEAMNNKPSKKPKIQTENVVLGPVIIETNGLLSGCIQLLKTGPKKGSQCGCKIFKDNFCKRHHNLTGDEN